MTKRSTTIIISFGCSVGVTLWGAMVRADNPSDATNKSLRLLESGRVGAAIKNFESTLRRNPDDLDSLLGMARLLKEKKDEHAADYYRKVLKLRPANRLALTSLVDVLSLDPKTRSESISLLLNYVQDHPKDIAARRRLAFLCSNDKRNHEEAIKQFAYLLKVYPNDTQMLSTMAYLLDWGPSWRDSEQYYRRYLNLKPDDDQVRLSYTSMLCWEKHDKDAALEQYHILRQRHPDDMKLLLDEACFLAWNNSPKEALDRFQKLLSKDPHMILEGQDKKKTPLVLYAASVARIAAHDFPLAEQLYKRHLSEHPQDVTVRCDLANMYAWESHQPQRAIEQFDMLLRAKQDNQLRLKKAYILMGLSRHRDAIAELEAVCKNAPLAKISIWFQGRMRDMPACIALARELDLSNQTDEAKKIYGRYLATHQGDALVRRELESIADRQLGYSLPELDELLRRHPDNAEYKLQKALYLWYDKRPLEALPYFQQVVAAGHEKEVLVYTEFQMRRRPVPVAYGLCLRDAGQISESERVLRQYLQSKPDDKSVRFELASLLANSNTSIAQSAALNELDKIIVPEKPPLSKAASLENRLYRMSRVAALSKLQRHAEALREIDDLIAINAEEPALPERAGDKLTPILQKACSLMSSNQPEKAETLLAQYLAGGHSHNRFARRLLAEALLLQGKHDQALDAADSLVRQSNDSFARELRGRVLVTAQKYGQAVEELSQLPQEQKQSPWVIHDLAHALKKSHHVEESINLLTEGVRAHPESPQLAVQLADLQAEQGKLEQALPLYRAAARNADKAPSYLIADIAAGLKRTTNSLQESLDMLRSAIERYPDDPILFCLLAQYQLEGGKPEAAHQLYRSAMEVSEKAPPYVIADIASGLRRTADKTAESVNLLQAAVQRYPNDPTLSCLLGQSLLDAGKASEAESIYRTALAQTPNNSALHSGLALVLAKQNKLGEAKVSANTSLDLAQGQEQIWRMYDLAGAKELKSLAVNRLRESVKQSVQNPEQMLLLINLELWDQESQSDGIAQLRQYLKLHPENETLWLTLANVLAWSKHGKESQQIYRDLILRHPDDLSLRLGMARAEAAAPALRNDAVKHFQQYLKAHPDDKQVERELADTLCWAGRQEEGIAIFQDLLHKDPENGDLRKARAQIEVWYAPTKRQGIQHLTEYVAANPQDADAKRTLAAVLSWTRGQQKKAVGLYQQLCQENDEEALKYEYAGLLGRTGRVKEAISLLKSMLEKRPDSRWGLLGMADVYITNGDILKAESILKKARKLYPNDEQIARTSASNFQNIGRYDLAISEAKRWKELYQSEESTAKKQ